MKVFWTKGPILRAVELLDLSNDPEYSQRLQYLGDKQQNCTVRLSHVTLKDSHMYYFRFITDKDDGKYTGAPGVTLNVTDLQVESPERVTEGDSVNLRCKSSCALTDRATFICPSHICALKDSTVIMRCTYKYPTGHQIEKVFWTNESIKGKEPPDLSNDTEYSKRLQYLGDKQQNCTIRLSHVTLKDSHMYYFRFITNKPDGKYTGAAGVNLTVTDRCAVQLNVMYPPRNVSVLMSGSGEIVEGDSVTLNCISDSNPPALNFSWFKENETSAVGSGQSFSALQSGRFYCQAHNQHGSQRSDAVTVTVKVAERLVILYISIGGVCGAAVIITMLVIWGTRCLKQRNDTQESQINHSRPDHDRHNAYDVELSDPVYENVMAAQLDDCKPELDSSLYENLRAN
ncbi:unnamed protein product [Leuciscus chuanchicus]